MAEPSRDLRGAKLGSRRLADTLEPARARVVAAAMPEQAGPASSPRIGRARSLNSPNAESLGDSPGKRLRAAWGELRVALEPEGEGSAALPDSLEALDARLQALGFTPEDAGAPGHYVRGDLRVAVSKVTIANESGVKLEPVGRGRRAREASETLGVTYLAGMTFPKTYWQQLERRQAEVERRWSKAAAQMSRFPTNLDELKELLTEGAGPEKQKLRAQRMAQIAQERERLSTLLKTCKAEGTAPKAILVYTEGPDAAGKTSTGEMLRPVFEEAGFVFKEHAFKAPTPEERAEHWLQRFRRHLPGEGEVMRWDRGPAGDAAYKPQTARSLRRLGQEFMDLEQDLLDHGVLVIPYYLYRDSSKQAATFGGREARARIARELLDWGAPAECERGRCLPEVARGLGIQDLRASLDFHNINAGFSSFVESTREIFPWSVINTNERFDARLKAIRKAQEALEHYAKHARALNSSSSSSSSLESGASMEE